MYKEINIDGLIGPTHHFGGLGVGNVASQASQSSVSNPQAAALEGLAKMELVDSLGVDQFYLPPPKRPNWSWLESVGFGGDPSDALRRCLNDAPSLLSAAFSSAFMWTANAATVAPSCDTSDGQLHFMPANLCCNLHRGQEAIERRNQLRAMFSRSISTKVHEPLPPVFALRDEGAANHMRLCSLDGTKAIHIFVYGPNELAKTHFIPRQSELATRQVAECLRLNKDDCIFAQQTARAIDAGVFHNDVIAMSHRNLLIFHEHAFDDSDKLLEEIERKYRRKVGEEMTAICVRDKELSIQEAVKTYLFNSQLLTVESDQMELLCPKQCEGSVAVQSIVNNWIANVGNPIRSARYLPLDQSMKNGGGPACLRLRAMLSKQELLELDVNHRATLERIDKLRSVVHSSYPTSLTLSDLVRPDFAKHSLAISQAIADIGRIQRS